MKTLYRTFASLILFQLCHNAWSCTTILVGDKASSDGSTMIARNDDHNALIAQHYVIYPAKDHAKGSLFHSHVNNFTYPWPTHAVKYTGIPSYGTHDQSHLEAGMNANNVAISATETIYNSAQALKDDPYVTKSGINEDSIAAILLPRLQSAKSGILELGHIIEKQGTAEGFGVAISDVHNIWYIETASGHQWVAFRIPDQAIFVSANQGRIQKINLKDTKNFLSSPGLIKYATTHHLYNPKQGAFNFRRAFMQINQNDQTYNYPRLAALFKLYNPTVPYQMKQGLFPTTFTPKHRLSAKDVMQGLQIYYQNSAYDPYHFQNPSAPFRPISLFRTMNSHIIALHANRPSAVAGVEYLALGMPNLGVYVPFLMGLNHAPKAYDLGTRHADSRSAFWAYRTLQTLAMNNFPLFGPYIEKKYQQLQAKLNQDVNRTILAYIKQPNQDLINHYTKNAVNLALDKTRQMTLHIITQMAKNTATTYAFKGA